MVSQETQDAKKDSKINYTATRGQGNEFSGIVEVDEEVVSFRVNSKGIQVTKPVPVLKYRGVLLNCLINKLRNQGWDEQSTLEINIRQGDFSTVQLTNLTEGQKGVEIFNKKRQWVDFKPTTEPEGEHSRMDKALEDIVKSVDRMRTGRPKRRNLYFSALILFFFQAMSFLSVFRFSSLKEMNLVSLAITLLMSYILYFGIAESKDVHDV